MNNVTSAPPSMLDTVRLENTPRMPVQARSYLVDSPQHEAEHEPAPSAIAKPRKTWRAWCVAGLVFLYLAQVSGQWRIGADSALYLLLAENLATGEGYTLAGEPHAHVPPGFPWVLSLFMQAGLSSGWAINLLAVAITLAALWTLYQLLSELGDERLAFYITLCTGCAWQYYFTSLRVNSDMPFLLVTWGGLWCCLRGLRRGGPLLDIGCMLLVAGCWVRVLGFPIAIAAVPALLVAPRAIPLRRVLLSAGLLGIMTAASAVLFSQSVQVASQKKFSSTYDTQINAVKQQVRIRNTNDAKNKTLELTRSFYTNSDEALTALVGFGTAKVLESALSEPGYVCFGFFSIWCLASLGWVRSVRQRQWYIAIVFLGYLGALTLMRGSIPRYWLPIVPLVIYFLVLGAMQAFTWINFRRAAGMAPAMIVGGLVVLNLPNAVYSIVCFRTSLATKSAPFEASIRRTAHHLSQTSDENTWFGGGCSSISYLSHRERLPGFDRWLAKVVSPDGDNLAKLMQEKNVSHLVINKPNALRPSRRKDVSQRLREAAEKAEGLVLTYQDNFSAVYKINDLQAGRLQATKGQGKDRLAGRPRRQSETP